MAYATSNLPSLIAQRVGANTGGAIWVYRDGDDLGVVSVNGYFKDAYRDIGMRAGDEILHIDTTNGVTNKLTVTAHTKGTASGAVTDDVEPVAETTIAVKASTGTGTFVENDIIEFDNDPGTYYRVTNVGDTDISDGASLVITPGLATATVADTTGITVVSNVLKAKPQVTTNVRDLTVASTLTIADSGTTFFLNSATEFATTLPAPMEGVNFKFIVKAAPAGANYTIVTSSNATIIQGLCVVNGASVAGADEDTITFTASAAVVGDWCELVSDGTNWYVSGQAVAATGITLTDAA